MWARKYGCSFLDVILRAHNIELKDHGPEMLHKVPDGLESPHPNVKKTGNALLPLDRAHILSDKLL